MNLVANRKSRIYVAGHRGLVGSAILRNLESAGYANIITANRDSLDLRDSNTVKYFFARNQPEYVFLAAAKVGGIGANLVSKGTFIYDNLMIQTNVIDAAYRNGCKKLLFLGSSCIYPKLAKVPIAESAILTGALETTNDAYAMAKLAGIKMCQAYREQYGFDAISVMPCNAYGPNDNFDLKTAHVLPALIAKIHDAKISEKNHIDVWGDGTSKREFIHADDLAAACVFLMENYTDKEPINVGPGIDVSINDLINIISEIVEYTGLTVYDDTKPSGVYRKVLNTEKLARLGFTPKIQLYDGIKSTYEWYKKKLAFQVKI